jgi:hypothetical protein
MVSAIPETGVIYKFKPNLTISMVALQASLLEFILFTTII